MDKPMRKRAYCQSCKKWRNLRVEVFSFKFFEPSTEDFYYADSFDGNVQCTVCYSCDVDLSKEESDQLVGAAVGAAGWARTAGA